MKTEFDNIGVMHHDSWLRGKDRGLEIAIETLDKYLEDYGKHINPNHLVVHHLQELKKEITNKCRI